MNIKKFDIYWVNLDPAIGKEINKTRPAIVVSPNKMNDVLGTVIVVPITKTIINWPFRTTIRSTKTISSAACDHVRSVSKKRLVKKIGNLKLSEQHTVTQILQTMFGI
jgi:mRNA interferase MazF